MPKKKKEPENIRLNVDINCTVEMSIADYEGWQEYGDLDEMETALYLAPHDTVHDAWITSVDKITEIERY